MLSSVTAMIHSMALVADFGPGDLLRFFGSVDEAKALLYELLSGVATGVTSSVVQVVVYTAFGLIDPTVADAAL